MRILKRTHSSDVTSFHDMVAVSDPMMDLFKLVERLARTDIGVLIRGETGTGKECVARAIHDLSPRASGPFQVVNCATLTGDLLASELFGHVRGAFTGAHKDRKGVFALANGGTLFLDEVAEIPLEVQARLLRVLQSREFVPVGGTEPQTVDIRILSATHRALRREVQKGNFRADLMYRIRVHPLYLPPLRERPGDIAVLFWHFVDQFNGVGERTVHGIEFTAMEALKTYSWPGNIRELRNLVEGAMAVGDGPILSMDELTPDVRGEPPPASAEAGFRSLADEERAGILVALGESRGHKGKAATALGMSRTTLWRKMRELKVT